MNQREHKRYLMIFTLIPFFGTVVGAFLLGTGQVAVSDWVSFAAMYCVAGLGVSTGYHRLLSHRAFRTSAPLRYAFATAGAIAGQGPPIIWVAHHRHHHRDADKPGDPHSPYDVHNPEERLTLRGFWRSHLSWLFDDDLTSDPIRYCPDLARDRGMRFISNNFVAVVVLGVVMGGAIGWLVGGTPMSFLTGMLWGGLVRLFIANHLTYAVNSVGHTLGPRRFPTPDESRNVAWLAIPTFGEAWHNNHHAFPRSYRHGLVWYEIDISAMIIWTMEKLGLASDVVRIDRLTRARVAEANWVKHGGGRASPAAPPAPLAALKVPEMRATDVE